MGEKQTSTSSGCRGVVAAYERWAYGQGWIAGLDEGKRQGFDEGYGVGFDVGANIGASRLLTALKVIVDGWSPDLLREQCGPESAGKSPEGHAEGML